MKQKGVLSPGHEGSNSGPSVTQVLMYEERGDMQLEGFPRPVEASLRGFSGGRWNWHQTQTKQDAKIPNDCLPA